MSDANDFPKWIEAHASHDLNLIAKTFEIHRDRVTGAVKVLVHSVEDEAKLLAEQVEHVEESKEEEK